jgi:hypothetical protein
MRDWDKEDAAHNPNADQEVLEELSRSTDWHIRRAVASNPSVPEALLRSLARDKVQWVREAVAGSHKAPQDVHICSQTTANGFVRASVALNPSTIPQTCTLTWHIRDDGPGLPTSKNRMLVKEAVAKNPNTHQRTLELLAKEKDEHVRSSAVSNPNLPSELFSRLPRDTSWLVRNSAARNPSTPKEVLAALSRDLIT